MSAMHSGIYNAVLRQQKLHVLSELLRSQRPDAMLVMSYRECATVHRMLELPVPVGLLQHEWAVAMYKVSCRINVYSSELYVMQHGGSNELFVSSGLLQQYRVRPVYVVSSRLRHDIFRRKAVCVCDRILWHQWSSSLSSLSLGLIQL